MKYQRLIPLITPLSIWLLSQAFLATPSFFYSSLALGILLIILSVKYLIPKDRFYWLPFIIPPVLFFLSFTVYASVVISHFWIQLIFLFIVWFIFYYLRGIYYYAVQINSSQNWELKLDNLLVSGGFLTIFAATAVLFDLPAFLNWPLYFLLPTSALIIGLLFFQFRLLSPDGRRPTTGLLVINTLALTEFIWIFSILPLNYNILALFSAIFYYVGLTIVRLDSRGSLNRRSLKLPLILSALAILLLLLTSRWL